MLIPHSSCILYTFLASISIHVLYVLYCTELYMFCEGNSTAQQWHLLSLMSEGGLAIHQWVPNKLLLQNAAGAKSGARAISTSASFWGEFALEPSEYCARYFHFLLQMVPHRPEA